MAIKALIFDMGGVLLRTMDHTPREQLAKQLGITRHDLEMLVFASDTSVMAETGGISEKEHWDFVFNELNVPPAQQEEFQRTFWSKDFVDEDLIDFIRGLRASYRTGLLSNAWDGIRSAMMQRFPQMLEVFDVSVFSAEVGMRKPDLRYYQWMVDKLGVDPAEGIFVDDFPPNITAAREIGLHAVHFKNPEQAREEVLALLYKNQGS